MAIIQRGLHWIARALELRGAPQLGELWPGVQPTVDVMNPWGFVDQVYQISATNGPSAAARYVTLIDGPATPLVEHYIIALEAFHAGGAAAVVTYVALGAQEKLSRLSAANVGVDGVATMRELFGNTTPVRVHNTATFQVRLPTTGVGESFTVQGLFLRVPAGLPHLF